MPPCKPLLRLQKAGRTFLLRLVAEFGPLGQCTSTGAQLNTTVARVGVEELAESPDPARGTGLLMCAIVKSGQITQL